MPRSAAHKDPACVAKLNPETQFNPDLGYMIKSSFNFTSSKRRSHRAATWTVKVRDDDTSALLGPAALVVPFS